MTIAQTIFARVKEEFARGNTCISKSEIIGWDIFYEERGQTKHANGDTKARKLRMLVESNYLGREEKGGQAYIVPATGQIKPLEDDVDEVADDTPRPKVRYQAVFDANGKPTGFVKPVPYE